MCWQGVIPAVRRSIQGMAFCRTERRRMMGFEILPFIITLLPTIIFIAVLYYIIRTATGESSDKKKYTIPVKATVIDVKQRDPYEYSDKDYNSQPLYYPEVEYTYKGKLYRDMYNIGTEKPVYRMGQSIDIMLDPENPNLYRIVKKQRKTADKDKKNSD